VQKIFQDQYGLKPKPWLILNNYDQESFIESFTSYVYESITDEKIADEVLKKIYTWTDILDTPIATQKIRLACTLNPNSTTHQWILTKVHGYILSFANTSIENADEPLEDAVLPLQIPDNMYDPNTLDVSWDTDRFELFKPRKLFTDATFQEITNTFSTRLARFSSLLSFASKETVDDYLEKYLLPYSDLVNGSRFIFDTLDDIYASRSVPLVTNMFLQCLKEGYTEQARYLCQVSNFELTEDLLNNTTAWSNVTYELRERSYYSPAILPTLFQCIADFAPDRASDIAAQLFALNKEDVTLQFLKVTDPFTAYYPPITLEADEIGTASTNRSPRQDKPDHEEAESRLVYYIEQRHPAQALAWIDFINHHHEHYNTSILSNEYTLELRIDCSYGNAPQPQVTLTPVLYAILLGKFKISDHLLAAGATLPSREEMVYFLKTLVAHADNLACLGEKELDDILTYILEKNTQNLSAEEAAECRKNILNQCDNSNQAPLHLAIQKTDWRTVKLFIAHGADVPNDITPLTDTAFNQLLECATSPECAKARHIEAITFYLNHVRNNTIDQVSLNTLFYHALKLCCLTEAYQLYALGAKLTDKFFTNTQVGNSQYNTETYSDGPQYNQTLTLSMVLYLLIAHASNDTESTSDCVHHVIQHHVVELDNNQSTYLQALHIDVPSLVDLLDVPSLAITKKLYLSAVNYWHNIRSATAANEDSAQLLHMAIINGASSNHLEALIEKYHLDLITTTPHGNSVLHSCLLMHRPPELTEDKLKIRRSKLFKWLVKRLTEANQPLNVKNNETISVLQLGFLKGENEIKLLFPHMNETDYDELYHTPESLTAAFGASKFRQYNFCQMDKDCFVELIKAVPQALLKRFAARGVACADEFLNNDATTFSLLNEIHSLTDQEKGRDYYYKCENLQQRRELLLKLIEPTDYIPHALEHDPSFLFFLYDRDCTRFEALLTHLTSRPELQNRNVWQNEHGASLLNYVLGNYSPKSNYSVTKLGSFPLNKIARASVVPMSCFLQVIR